jgi:hypothetical protein
LFTIKKRLLAIHIRTSRAGNTSRPTMFDREALQSVFEAFTDNKQGTISIVAGCKRQLVRGRMLAGMPIIKAVAMVVGYNLVLLTSNMVDMAK